MHFAFDTPGGRHSRQLVVHTPCPIHPHVTLERLICGPVLGRTFTAPLGLAFASARQRHRRPSSPPVTKHCSNKGVEERTNPR